MEWTAKRRFLTALSRGKPDRLPVTTHHLMKYFLDTYMNGIDEQSFFDYFGLDPILWTMPIKPNFSLGEYWSRDNQFIISDSWRVERENLGYEEGFPIERVNIITPKGNLSCVRKFNKHTVWLLERPIKKKSDINLLEYITKPVYDVDLVNKFAEEFGERGLVRGTVMPCFDVFGQPGCWQDAACMYGIENLILETFYDPIWVHEFLSILRERKLVTIKSLKGAKYDILELGGGDASSTVISPSVFEKFVAPYDSVLIEEIHKQSQKIVYHTCGGMMPILDLIVSMGPDAIETLTPTEMGGDVNLREVKKRVGDKVCLIGGFDQYHYFIGCSSEDTRKAVRKCFEEAGEGGGYILSPSDHFFDANLELIRAYADEAKKCHY
ncbi:MAG: hypothetical protein N3G21_06420 [Candidatus Hydrogenedentes bacterium]|nr:hypothetical protein [Candidatus Hydrogenedentota bacterium]